MTTTDANGIIRYQDSDGAPTPPVLNMGLQSVSDAMSNLNQYRVVHNIAERNAYALANPPTTQKPLLVYRINAPTSARFEWTNNGTSWVNIVGLPDLLTNTSTINVGTFSSSALVYTQSLPAVDYRRRLVITANILAFDVVGNWDACLSVGKSQANESQRIASIPSGQSRVSTSISYIHTLAADEATTVRLWFQRISPSGSITSNGTRNYTFADVQSYPLPSSN